MPHPFGFPGAIADDLSERLRAGEAESLLERLRALEAPPTLGSAEAPAPLAAHLHRHREHRWYDEARKLGLGVGTGIAVNGVGELRQFLAQAKGSTAEPHP